VCRSRRLRGLTGPLQSFAMKLNVSWISSLLLATMVQARPVSGQAGCPAKGSGPAFEVSAARCLADTLPAPRRTGPQRPIILYVDRSRSMAGFLDKTIELKGSDYRSVLNELKAGLSPKEAHSFGSSLKKIALLGGALENPSFYTDGDTQLEDVLPLVKKDSQLGSTHIIIGDGRRGSGTAAIAQYDAMRGAAADWVTKGGTFIVAASPAPFTPQAGDPSGCHTAMKIVKTAQCPIYAFIFAARGDEERVLQYVGRAFRHVFAWPAPIFPKANTWKFTLPPGSGLFMNPAFAYAFDGTPISKVWANTPKTLVEGKLSLVDRTSLASRWRQSLLSGGGFRQVVRARSLRGGPWATPTLNASLVQAKMSEDAVSVSVASHGSGSQPATLYAVDLVPSGQPSWLKDFGGTSPSHTSRTYALSRLFTWFELNAAEAAYPAARFFFVVN
jgi:hypothetical protein